MENRPLFQDNMSKVIMDAIELECDRLKVCRTCQRTPSLLSTQP